MTEPKAKDGILLVLIGCLDGWHIISLGIGIGIGRGVQVQAVQLQI
jgi:hypothetical protein